MPDWSPGWDEIREGLVVFVATWVLVVKLREWLREQGEP
jgi:hypothetical protein